MKEEDKNPWTTLEIKEVYDNPWIRVTHEDVISPGGNEGIYGKVHFKNTAIAIVPIDRHQHTWLIGQYRYTLNEYSWEVPEGGGPLDRPIQESAQRELLEETGLIAERWEHVLELTMSNSVTDERAHVFLARGLSQQSPDPDDTEELKIKKLPFDAALEMIDRGIIQDSLSVNALWAVDRYIR